MCDLTYLEGFEVLVVVPSQLRRKMFTDSAE